MEHMEKKPLNRQILFQVNHEGHGSLLNIPLVKLSQNNYLSQLESHKFQTNTVIIFFFQIAFILNLSTNFKKTNLCLQRIVKYIYMF